MGVYAHTSMYFSFSHAYSYIVASWSQFLCLCLTLGWVTSRWCWPWWEYCIAQKLAKLYIKDFSSSESQFSSVQLRVYLAFPIRL